MSCNFYVHNDSLGGNKNISGTTCDGTVVNYYLTYGQSVCMDDSLPLINLNGLVISGTCFDITPTPTQTLPDYCIYSASTFYSAPYQCPNDGLTYYDTYGKIYVSLGSRTVGYTEHPPISFVVSNGIDTETVIIEPGQTFNEFIYPKINFVYTDSGCVSTTYPDWSIVSITGGYTDCPITPTPTPSITASPTQTKTPTQTQTSTQTPTQTQTSTPVNTTTPTPTQTPTQSPNPACPEEIIVTNSSSIFLDNGTYIRQYVASGTSFFYGYSYQNTPNSGYIVLGTAPDGFNYPIYQYDDGGDTNTIYWCGDGIYANAWRAMEQNPNILLSGSAWVGSSISLGANYIQNGSVRYPGTGSVGAGYLAYPAVCPTTTPTPSMTASPTTTPTQTPTNTNTPTQTSTITTTPTQTPTNTNTPTTTQTPTRTTTPTPTRSYFAIQLNYVGKTTQCDSCYEGYYSQITAYLPATGDTNPDVGSVIYSNPSLTIPFDGDSRWWYYSITGGYSMLIQNSTGVVLSIYDCNSCPTQTPTQTITPTNTPTPSFTPSNTPTQTTTKTGTPTPTQTPTNTLTPTQTLTQTPTNTITQTPTTTPTQTSNFDSDAVAYLNALVASGATGMTATISAATQTLFISLKTNNLYNKIDVMYPFVGGTSGSTRIDAKNPTSSSYHLTYVGTSGWSFNASGATSNGTTGVYAGTQFNVNSNPLNDMHQSIYMLNNTVYTGTGKNYMGAAQGGKYFVIAQDGTPREFYGLSDGGRSTSNTPLSQGQYLISTTASTMQNLYRNGSLRATGSGSATAAITSTIYIGAMNNNGTAIQNYNNTYSFATIGNGLNATEISNLYSIIQTFQTSLSRNV